MLMKLSMPHLKFHCPCSVSSLLAAGVLTLAVAAALYLYFVFDQVFRQVNHVALASFAFHITKIALSVVCTLATPLASPFP